MRSILIIGLTSFGLLGACAEKYPVERAISAGLSRTDVLDVYKQECINEYGFNKKGSDLLASCVQSKDQFSKQKAVKRHTLSNDFFENLNENFTETFNKGSYTFKS